ncbi:hypothetical protein F8S13_05260 [Chloroflexia bacterium SDU3-3]|nr:hypothetical protein F8S13_05260 [Chloroflexia bacterium SDU3-3]
MAKKIQDIIKSAQIAIPNAINIDDIRTTLASYGYPLPKLEQGNLLLEALIAAQTKQQLEYGDQDKATQTFNDLWDQLDQIYTRQLKLARVALKGNSDAARDLALDGPRRKSFGGWSMQAQQFYAGLAANPSFAAALASFGAPLPEQEAASAALADVIAALRALENERGQAQIATRERDAAIDALDDWLGDFMAVARVAFADQPEHLERLGVTVRA